MGNKQNKKILPNNDNKNTKLDEYFFNITSLTKDLIKIIIDYDGYEPEIKGELYKTVGYHDNSDNNNNNKESQFGYPCQITTDGVYVYVSDGEKHKIHVLNYDGEIVRGWGDYGEDDGQFDGPYGIDIFKSHIYIADFGNSRIQIFNLPYGDFIKKFNCNEKCWLVRTYNSHIYVTFHIGNKIDVYTLDGIYINTIDQQFLQTCKTPHIRDLYFSDDKIYVAVNNSIHCLEINGRYNHRLISYISDYAISSIFLTKDSIYIGNYHKIQQLNKQGKFIREFWNNFTPCRDTIAITLLDNKFFAVDARNNCIHIFC